MGAISSLEGTRAILARELVTVAFQPVRNHSSLSQVKETGNQLLGRSLAAYGNDVARTAGVGRDIRLLAVHGDVTVGNKLTGAGTGIAEAEAVHNIVQTKLKELKQNIAGNAAAAGGFCIILAELTFKHTVLETQFLFFSKHHAIVGFLLAGRRACHAGREGRGAFQEPWWNRKGQRQNGGTLYRGDRYNEP